MREIAECQVSKDRLAIDPQAMIISAKDRKREEILQKRIGSTGQGVGQATARRVLRQKDVKLARDILELRPFLRSGSEVLEECFRKRQRVLLEGTQGMGLSLYHGHYPHVTSRDTTAAGCLAEAGISSNRVQRVILVSPHLPNSSPRRQRRNLRVHVPGNQLEGSCSEEWTQTLCSLKNRANFYYQPATSGRRV